VSAPLLTVVICTHNRVQLLARAIASLNAAARPDGDVQLLVVANNCGDGTHDYLAGYGRRPGESLPLRWLVESRPGKAFALNLALPEVKSAWVALVDDDQRADTFFLQSIADTASRSPDADILFGRIEPDWTGSEPDWVHDRGPYRIYPLPVPHIDLGDVEHWCDQGTAMPSGGNAVVKRGLIEKVGAFSTQLGPVGHNLAGGEDTDWFLRALRLGAKVRYVPAMIQYHYVDPARLSLGSLVRLAYARTAANVSLIGDDAAGLGVPPWAYRKLLRYAAAAATSLAADRRRHFIVRTAACLGEIAGYRRRAALGRGESTA